MVLRAMHICSGYGGFELGLRLAGVDTRTVCHIEIDAHAAAVLVARMEDETLDPAPVWADVGSFDSEPVAEWIWSLPGSLASRSPRPGSGGGWTTTDGSGPTSPGSSATWVQHGSSWRMFRGLSGMDSGGSSGTLPRWGSMRNGVVSQRPTWEHRTNGNVSGWWADDMEMFWPTPIAVRSGGNWWRGKSHGETLYDATEKPWLKVYTHGPRFEATWMDGDDSGRWDLSPRFVESLMGVPQGWLTPSHSVGTDSYRQWLHSHGTNLGRIW